MLREGLQTKKGKVRKKNLAILRKNSELASTILQLRQVAIQNNSGFWKKVVLELQKPRRNKRVVNIYKIQKLAKQGDVIVVPGKVLGTGDLSLKITIAAESFSKSALEKINSVGKATSLLDLARENPKGTGLKIIV